MKSPLAAILLSVLVAGSTAAQNDECAGAIPLAPGCNPAPAVSGNTFAMTGATVSAGWPNPPSCITTAIGADVWFSYVPSTSGVHRIDTEWPAGFLSGTLTDTTLEVFPDTQCLPTSSIACDDDSGTTSALLSVVTVNLTAGATYYVRVGDWGSFSGGTFYLTVTYLGPPPAHDECGSPVTVTTGMNPAPAASGNVFSNGLATTSPGWANNCSGASLVKDVWFTFTPLASGLHQIDTETPAGFGGGSLTDTVLEVHSASCVPGAALACDDDGGVTGNGLLSLVTLNLTAGATYRIRVGGYAGATVTEGTFYLTITYVGPALQNDDCGPGAIPLVVGTNPAPAASGNRFSNVGTTTTAGYPAVCAAIVNDAWFSFSPSVSDTYVFDTNTPCGFAAGTMTNTTIALYSAAACSAPGPPIACDADSGAGSLSLLQAPLAAGTTYYLRVGPATSAFQTFYVNVRQGALAGNDECSGAIPVGLGSNPAPGGACSFFTNDLATTSAGWAPICAAIVSDVWFTFTPPATGPYVIDTNNPCGSAAGTAANTTLAIYSSCNPALPPIACDADTGTLTLSLVNPTLLAGTPYLIRVGTTAAAGAGTFHLNVSPGVVGVPNDTCAAAVALGLGTNPAPAASCKLFSNEFATSDAFGYPALTGCGSPAIVNDVWFVFTPPVNGSYRFDTETPAGFAAGTNTNSTIAVYASCAPGPGLACDADSGVTGTGFMSIATVANMTAGVPVWVRVGSSTASVAGSFYLTVTRVFTLAFSSPYGQGSIQANIAAAPPNGSYYLCVTFYAGAFPQGFFLGVDPSLQEIADQVNFGAPFVGPVGPSGDVVLGPFAGLASGLTLYSVAIGFPGPLGAMPMIATAPKSYTIP